MNPAANKPAALDNVRIVLSHPSHPGNIGAAARAMKTMGLNALFLVNPKRFPDPEAEARASGALDVLQAATVCEDLDQALQGATLAVALTARRRDLSPEVLTVREAAPRMLDHAERQVVAVVFGTEMSGLTNAEVGKCQMLATIPASPLYPSLNLAAAVQVVAYELRQGCADLAWAKNSTRQLADLDDVERFYRHLEDVLVETGFLDPEHPKRLMSRLRRLFGRTRLEQEEVNILRGILTAVGKK